MNYVSGLNFRWSFAVAVFAASIVGVSTAQTHGDVFLAQNNADFSKTLESGDLQAAVDYIVEREQVENERQTALAASGLNSANLQDQMLSESGEADTLSSSEMFELLLKHFSQAEIEAEFSNSKTLKISYAPGHASERIRPLEKGKFALAEISVLTSGQASLLVEAKYQNAAYNVQLLSADGAVVCKSDKPTTRVNCNWQPVAFQEYRLFVDSLGPMQSVLRISLN